MDRLSDWNAAVDYIEEHLEEEIDFSVVASIARCSEYHFRRMFCYLAGVTLNEYIRRRRLTLAAIELSTTGTKIIDAAVKFGYESPDAFARAFCKEHGVTPSGLRTGKRPVKAYSRVAFRMSVQGGNEIKFRIVEKDAFRIVGIRRRVPLVFHGVNPAIAAMWRSLDDAAIRRLKACANTEPPGLISASANFSEGRMEERGELDHYIGAATVSDGPPGYEQLAVPALTWAVFESVGPFPETLQTLWGRIYSEWFPSSSFEQEDGPELLWNKDKDLSRPDYASEIWIPIKRRTRQ